MTRSITTRSPISELWKRRMVFASIGSTIITLIGIVIMAVECTKLQKIILQPPMLAGCVMYSAGVVFIYIILWVSIFWKHEYPTGPVVICSSVLHSLTGSALICVAYILPADFMFDFAFPQIDDGHVDSSTTTPVLDARHDTNRDIVILIQIRLTVLGGIIAGFGFLGGAISMGVIYRIHKAMKMRKDAEMERRRKSRRQWNHDSENNTISKVGYKKRGSVYDYAGWANRTKDIFQEDMTEKTRDGAFSRSPSILSSGPITGSGFDLRTDKHTAIDERNMVTSFSMASTVIRNEDVDRKSFNKKSVTWTPQKHKSSASMDIGQQLRTSKHRGKKNYTESFSMDDIYKRKSGQAKEELPIAVIEDED